MKKLLFLLFWVNQFSIQVQTAATADSARIFLQSYNYGKALKVVNRQLELTGNNAELLILKGTALKGLLKYPEAIYAFERALRTDSSGYQTYMDIALCQKALSNYSKALSNFEKAKALNPENMAISIEIAGILYVSENYEQAKQNYLSLYNRDTSNVFLIRNIAKCFENLNKMDSAAFFYQKAVSLNHGDAQSVYRLANIYAAQEKLQDGILITENYRRIDINNARINRTHAYLYFLKKEYKKAIDLFSACIKKNDTCEMTLKHLGLCFFKLERYDSARVYLHRAFVADSTNTQSAYLLGYSCTMCGHSDEGIFYLNKVIDLITPSPKYLSEIYQNLAEAYTNTKRYQLALNALLTAYKNTPLDTMLLFRLGNHYDEKLNNKKMAIKYYSQFMKTRPMQKKAQPRPAGIIPRSCYDIVENRLEQIKNATASPQKYTDIRH